MQCNCGFWKAPHVKVDAAKLQYLIPNYRDLYTYKLICKYLRATENIRNQLTMQNAAVEKIMEMMWNV
jgi:hypothetical protein